MKRLSRFWLIAALILSCNVLGLANTTPRYIFTDLGNAEENSDSSAVAINNLGQVIIHTNNERRSFVWIPNKRNGTVGRLWDMGVILPDYVDPEWGTETIAYDINDNGEIVGISGSGWHYKGSRSARPFRTRVGKKLDKSCIMLGRNGGTAPYAINNRGIVVGEYEGASSSHAVKWSANGRGASLGKLHNGEWITCAALGISDSGTIVGLGEKHAWVLRGTHKRDLGEGIATSINNHGIVTGISHGRACIWVGAKRYWLDHTQYRPNVGYEETSFSVPGFFLGFSSAEDINDEGQTVGHLSVFLPAGNNSREHYENRAALWSGGKTVDLNEICGIPQGWTLVSAQAINNKGQIVGCGRLAANPNLYRAFLLTPIKIARTFHKN